MVREGLSYTKTAALMAESFDLNRDKIDLPETGQEILNIDFLSQAHEDLPGENDHIKKNPAFLALLKYYLTKSTAANKEIFNSLKTPDKDIEENNRFRYPVLKPSGKEKCDKVILLLHGLNERSWLKYLPWASRLSEETGAAVVLFPIAFHMNRSPEAWSDIRRMMPVTRERKSLLPDLECSSFANAALSYRMQFAPQRFVLSGIQTFIDLLGLLEQIKAGTHPGIETGAEVDFFSYSIGATLTEVLMMANPMGLLSRSRAVLFCGGPALNMATPVNRAIIDKQAFESLIQHFHDILSGRAEELEVLEKGRGANTYRYLKSLMLFEEMADERNARFMELEGRLKVIALKGDKTMPEASIEKTFAPTGIPVETVDFGYPCTHENPFPVQKEQTEKVDQALEGVMRSAATFYRNRNL